MTLNYFMKATGIPINFGIAILLAIIIGTAIVGQTFYSFTTDNLKYFATLRAMGARKKQLLVMVFLQAAISGITGYGLGLGVASLFYRVSLKSELAFRMIWQIPVFSGCAVIFVCLFAALLSIWKVLRLEPAIVFK